MSDQLTDCLGATASVDRAVAYGLAASVLDANEPRDHSIYLQGIDSAEIIDAVHARRRRKRGVSRAWG